MAWAGTSTSFSWRVRFLPAFLLLICISSYAVSFQIPKQASTAPRRILLPGSLQNAGRCQFWANTPTFLTSKNKGMLGQSDGREYQEGVKSTERSKKRRRGLLWHIKRALRYIFVNPEMIQARIYTLSLALAFAVRALVADQATVASGSMAPTLRPGDRVVIAKCAHRFSPPKRQQIVAFRPPQKAVSILAVDKRFQTKSMKVFIKRIVGVEGDTIEVVDGRLLINGIHVNENSYVEDKGDYCWGPHVIPQGTVAVLGDRRTGSLDSHYWGFLKKDEIMGQVVAISWPPSRVTSKLQ